MRYPNLKQLQSQNTVNQTLFSFKWNCSPHQIRIGLRYKEIAICTKIWLMWRSTMKYFKRNIQFANNNLVIANQIDNQI